MQCDVKQQFYILCFYTAVCNLLAEQFNLREVASECARRKLGIIVVVLGRSNNNC